MKILKNYFLIFFITYIILLFTKFLFVYFTSNSLNIYPFYGYKYDFAISAFIAFLATVFDLNKKISIIFGGFLISSVFLLQIGDMLYFQESSRHISYEIFDIFTDAKSLFMTALTQYKVITIVSIIIYILIFVGTIKLFSKLFSNIFFTKSYIFTKLFIIVITVFFIRGMFQHIPLTPWQANKYGSNISKYIVNGSYTTLYALGNAKRRLKPINIKKYPNKDITKTFKRLYPKTNIPQLPVINTKPNIVLFFLESWSGKYLKPYGFKETTTPNFDKILKKSIHPTAMIASGHRTTEGMFATLVSYQNPLGKSVAKSQLQNFSYTSIIDILNKLGYSSAFFQGTAKETSGTGSLALSLGFKYSYGKYDIKKRIYPTNYWGVHDTDLYNFVEKKLSNTLKEPFVIGINGATTHDDKIPPSVKKINFVKDKKINNQLNALHFSDKALGEFIKEIEQKYPNTIFVLFADHCGGGLKGTLENYIIPFAIYSKMLKPKSYDLFLSQRDIAPTVLDLVTGDYKKLAPNFSGKSLISDKKFFADFFHNGTLGWIKDKKLVEINIYNNKTSAYTIKNLNKSKTDFTDDFKDMKTDALIFTYISQKLLFKGKTDEFHKWRNHD